MGPLMASIATEGLITTMKAVAEGASVVNRDVVALRFGTDAYPELSDSERTKRARVTKSFDCRIVSMGRHPQSCSAVYSRQLYLTKVRCTHTRHIDPLVKLDQTTRDALLGNQWEDVDIIAQAMEYPGNVAWDTAAGGLVSQSLKHVVSDLGRVELGPNPPNFVETIMNFECVLYVNAN